MGFLLTVISGGALAAAKATSLMLNPILLVKLVFVVLAAVTMRALEKKVFSPESLKGFKPGDGRVMAATLLVLWTIVMTAGRLIAYSMTIFF